MEYWNEEFEEWLDDESDSRFSSREEMVEFFKNQREEAARVKKQEAIANHQETINELAQKMAIEGGSVWKHIGLGPSNDKDFPMLYDVYSSTIKDHVANSVPFTYGFCFIFENETGKNCSIEHGVCVTPKNTTIWNSGEVRFSGVKTYGGRMFVKNEWVDLFGVYFDHLQRFGIYGKDWATYDGR